MARSKSWLGARLVVGVVLLTCLAPACLGDIGGGQPEMTSAAPQAIAVGLRRLTAHEYDSTIHDLLFDDTAEAELNLPADARTPFDNDVDTQDISSALVEGVELLAGDAAERL